MSDLKEDIRWGYRLLDQTSRSFAVVIKSLDEELRDPMMVFYLALRALDSVEDDTSYPLNKKLKELHEFHTRLDKKTWTWTDKCGEKPEEEVLLKDFIHVLNAYHSMRPGYREVVKDICARMGKGMAEFCEKKVESIADYNLYCHYVAGLVGIGLSRMFAASGLEDRTYFLTHDDISNSCGLFLQKVNITRDYLEDLEQNRIFWPREIWKQYAENLKDFTDPANAQKAVYCLNHMVADAMTHSLDSMDYMKQLKSPSVFLFVSIPQVMAMATLALLAQNHGVFTGVVKIPRKATMKIIANIQQSGMKAVLTYYFNYAQQIEVKIPPNDPNRGKIVDIVSNIRSRCGNSSSFLIPIKAKL